MHAIAPKEVVDWIENRTLSFLTLLQFHVRWNGVGITIPVYDENGKFLFNKYRRDPRRDDGPKYRYDTGAGAALYGAQNIKDADTIIVCEGEMDALVLYSHGFTAVSSTGGAGTFLPEWVELLKGKEVIICYDNDTAGINGALRVQEMIPWGKIARIPDLTGVKDITDYCVRLKKNDTDIVNSLIAVFGLAKTYPLYIDSTLTKKEQIKIYQDRMKDGYELRSEISRKMQPTTLIDRYLEILSNRIVDLKKREKKIATRDLNLPLIDRAKAVPMTEILEFKRGFAQCPFHAEKSSSFHYLPASNKGHCFGCNRTADVIEVVAQLNNIKYMEAAKTLAK